MHLNSNSGVASPIKTGVAKVFETGAKLKKWLMVDLVQPRLKAQR